MPAAKIPNNEEARLLALKRLRVLDTFAEAEFDAIVKAASLVCGVPISLISLVDENRQWFKANVGLEGVSETPRDLAFCAHAILGDQILEVQDATQDIRFSDNPLVLGDPNIRFYAGVPLRLTTGENVGTLCVIDSKPQQLSEYQLSILSCLATAATQALESHQLRESQLAILSAKAALLEAADYTASIFKNSKEPIVAIMLDGTITHWNNAAEKLFGYTSEQILGENISILVPPEYLNQHSDIISNIASLADGIAYETKRLSQAGLLIDVSVSLAPLFNGAGSLIGATKILHDIREQNLTRSLLSSNEAKYRALSDTSPLGVFATDAKGYCIYTNKRWQEIFGLNYEESLGLGWSDTIHPLDRESVFDEWQRSAIEHIEFDMEFRIRQRDGTIRYVHSRSRPVIDEEDNVTSFVGSVEDITDRRRTLERLATSEERLRKLYQSTPAMMQSIDPEGRLISVSDYWLVKHGYTRDEVIGRYTTDFMLKESADYAREVVIPKIMQDGFCENIPYKKVKKNGEVFDVLMSSFVERDTAGNVLRAMAVLVDVTAENAAKRATEELLSTMRTQFITSITNDQGDILEVNDAFCELSKYSADELIGVNHNKVNSGVHPKEFFASMWKVIASGSTWQGEKCNRAKDGSLYWINTVIAPLKDSEGKINRYISIASNITNRKNAENDLIEQKNKIQQILDNQSVATFMIDVQHKVTHWNKACEFLTGKKEKSILGSKAWRAFYSEERPCLADLLLDNQIELASKYYPVNQTSTLIKNGWHSENWFESLGGKRRYVIFDAAPIFGANGEITAVIESLQDVTETKNAEIALKEEEQYLASVIEGTRAGTWQWNVATGEARFNDYWAEMLGYRLDEFGEQTVGVWSNLLHPDDAALCETKLNAHFEGLTDKYDAEFRMRHKDGHWIWIFAHGRVLSWTEANKPAWMYGTHTDITLRKQQEDALKASNDRVSIATKSGGIGIWSYDVLNDELHSDSTINSLYGLLEDEVLTVKSWMSMLHPDDREDTVFAFQDAIAGNSQYDVEFRAVWRDGSIHYIRAKATVTSDHQGRALHMLGTNWDVTNIRELTLEVAKQHETLRVTLQSIGDAVITTDAKGRVSWLNPVAERMTGWLTSEAKGKALAQIFNILNETTRKVAENPVVECLRRGKIVGLANHTILISRDGIEYGIEDSASPIRSDDGKIIGVVLVFHDVTEQRRMSNEMSHRATHDSLTGLLNRTEFETRLTRVLNHAKTEGSMHSLMFIDLDQFKLVNDACGHSAGDLLLQQVTKMLFEIVRSRDTLARLGGDEFGVILEQCTTEQAQRVAQTICDRMDDYRFIHDGKRFRIGTSIGLTVIDGRWADIANAIQAADSACYAAKEAGRNRVHTWFDTDASMRAHQGQMQWATCIELAMDENKFELFAQRIFTVDQDDTLQTESKIHAEILLRLRGADGEVISPGVFLPAAERFHLASRLDRWVLQHVIDWLESLQDLAVVSTICVNLSGQSIGDRSFHAHTIEILTKVGRNICECICLEITETATVTNIVDASIFIDQVRLLGVRVALDDFGAGASSFGYLKTLTVDVLKIDGQFIKAMIHDPLDDSAVRCFVDVAKIMGLKTVAEYVESPAILAHVRGLGIDYAQGYLLHKPSPIESLTDSNLLHY